jgi:hypothetical protein
MTAKHRWRSSTRFFVSSTEIGGVLAPSDVGELLTGAPGGRGFATKFAGFLAGADMPAFLIEQERGLEEAILRI